MWHRILAVHAGISARQRKAELERLNDQLRKINLSLRQQARSQLARVATLLPTLTWRCYGSLITDVRGAIPRVTLVPMCSCLEIEPQHAVNAAVLLREKLLPYQLKLPCMFACHAGARRHGVRARAELCAAAAAGAHACPPANGRHGCAGVIWGAGASAFRIWVRS